MNCVGITNRALRLKTARFSSSAILCLTSLKPSPPLLLFHRRTPAEKLHYFSSDDSPLQKSLSSSFFFPLPHTNSSHLYSLKSFSTSITSHLTNGLDKRELLHQDERSVFHRNLFNSVWKRNYPAHAHKNPFPPFFSHGIIVIPLACERRTHRVPSAANFKD